MKTFAVKVKAKVLTIPLYDSKRIEKMLLSNQPVLQIHWILQCWYALPFEEEGIGSMLISI